MVDKLPTWKGRLIHRSGHLVLIKSTMHAIPTYTTISLEIPAWLLKAVEGIMKCFLWSRSKEMQKGKSMVAWSCSIPFSSAVWVSSTSVGWAGPCDSDGFGSSGPNHHAPWHHNRARRRHP
jgi:hypothetical protein